MFRFHSKYLIYNNSQTATPTAKHIFCISLRRMFFKKKSNSPGKYEYLWSGRPAFIFSLKLKLIQAFSLQSFLITMHLHKGTKNLHFSWYNLMLERQSNQPESLFVPSTKTPGFPFHSIFKMYTISFSLFRFCLLFDLFNRIMGKAFFKLKRA